MKKISISKFTCSFFFLWTFALNPLVLLLDSFSYIKIEGFYLISFSLSLIVFFFYIKNAPKMILRESYLSLLSLLGLSISLFILIINGQDIYGYTEDGQLKSIFSYFAPPIIYSLGMLSLGRLIDLNTIFKSKLIYLSIFPCILILLLTKDFRVNYSLLKDPSLIGIYLYIGDALSIIFLIICFRNGFKLSSIVWFLFFSLILYLNNSRAAFFVFIFIFSLSSALFILKLSLLKKIIYISLISLTILLLSPYIYEFITLNERMANLITGHADYSRDGRSELFNLGLSDIENNLFTGLLGGQVLAGERLGAYIHNILEYYRQFGLVAFIFILLSVIFSLLIVINFILKNKKVTETIMLIPILIFISSLILCIFARSIPYTYIFFSIGLLENIYSNYKKEWK